MVQNPTTKSFEPFNFKQIESKVPELKRFDCKISTIQFEPPLDSSDINPSDWVKMATIIGENYEKYNGFVILHGTDTMSYSASALSFMLQNLHKPVIFTGAQLPIGIPRTDGRENLLTSIEIASSEQNSEPTVPEVCIYFNSFLFRANRTSKIDSHQFRAFDSKNYPPLAKAGVNITYFQDRIFKPDNSSNFSVNDKLDTHVVILKIFPGINHSIFKAISGIEGLRGIVLESFGSGNVPNLPWLNHCIENAVEKGIIILNISQCAGGSVALGQYETSINLLNAGVISGRDMTTEAAVTKLMYLLGQGFSREEVTKSLNLDLRGEITI